MANTIMSAKNSFQDGLLLDFSPENSKATSMTAALNATLVTFNGNEMSLQNDMGNGRVETAFLPEGYVPVGSCEFGDIIYIVSYNPLINKSQIGCFPSPERNISSEEISVLKQSLSWKDFQKGDSSPNGKLNNLSVKKILYEKKLNPGDKFIIYTAKGDVRNNSNVLSDIGNQDHIHGYWPKLTKVHVVSIEDSGKMVYLDSSLKWYDDINYYIQKQSSNEENKPDLDSYRSLVNSAYSIFQSKVSGKLALLVELEKITSFSCTHSVYQNIPQTCQEGINNSDYHIFVNISWESPHNDINPSGIIVTKSEWENTTANVYSYSKVDDSYILNQSSPQSVPISDASINGGYDVTKVIPIHRIYKLESPASKYDDFIKNKSYNAQISNKIQGIRQITVKNKNIRYPELNNDVREYFPNLAKLEYQGNSINAYTINTNGVQIPVNAIKLSDDIVNNYFHKDVLKFIATKSYPTIQRINGKDYKLDLSELIWNYTIAPVMPYGTLDYLSVNNTIDFSKINSGINQLTGWRYHNNGQQSVITLDVESYPEEGKGIAEIVLEFFDNQGKAAAYHISGKSSYSGTFTEYIQLNAKNINHKQNNIGRNGSVFTHKGLEDPSGTITYNGKKYIDDSGTIYTNALYKVLITLKYCNIDNLGNYNTEDETYYKYYTRWFYTTELFNENYFNTKDFDLLQPQLAFDISTYFKNSNIDIKETNYNVETKVNNQSKIHNTIGAKVVHINQDESSDQNGNLLLFTNLGLDQDYGVFNINADSLSSIKIDTILGKSDINVPSDIKQISESETINIPYIYPTVAKDLSSNIGNIDRSGYISYLYGDNKCQVSTDLLKLLVGETASFKASGAITGKTDENIYSKEESYLNYLDSFSLNFAKQVNYSSSNNQLEYINNKSESVQLETPYLINSSWANVTYNQGIPLTLTGIFYNKFIYSAIIKKTIDKCLKSVLLQSNLDTYGLRYSGDHMYFKAVASIGWGRSNNSHTRWRGLYTGNNTSSGWPSTYEYDSGKIKQGDEGEVKEINDGQIQEQLLPNVENYLTPVILAHPHTEGDYNEFYTINRECYRNLTGYIPGINYSTKTQLYLKDKMTYVDGTSNSNATHMITMLGYRDINTGLVQLLNDFFISGARSQTYAGKSNSEIPSGTTQADMVAGLYSQLYSAISGSLDIYQGSNLTYLGNFQEIWTKEIINKISPIEKANSLLLFHKYPISSYIKDVKDNLDFSLTGMDGTDNNVEFKIDGITKTTLFQFALSYDISEIRLLNKDIQNSALITYDNQGNEVTTPISGNIMDDTLYTVSEGTAIKLSGSSKIYDVSSWINPKTDIYIPVLTTNTIEASNNLGKFLGVQSGILTFGSIDDLPQSKNTFTIHSENKGDNSGISKISGGSIFNKLKVG